MSQLIKPPPPSVPFGYLPNGTPVRIDTAWDLFLRAIVERTGGIDAPTNSELSVALHDDAGIEESKAEMYRLREELSVTPTLAQMEPKDNPDALIQDLIAQVAEMRKEIESLKAGTVL